MAVVITVKVKPRSKQAVLVARDDGTFEAQIKAPPVDGKANDALIVLLAEHFGVRKRDVEIRTGAHSRIKVVRIEGVEA